MIREKLLVIAGEDCLPVISSCLEDVDDLEIIEADSENKAFELIYNHFFVLMIVDETLPHIDMYKIGSMLLSHKDTCNVPLLVISDDICPGKFLDDFRALEIDYIAKPFDRNLIRAKINIFFDLFQHRNAVAQSIDELDKAYQKILFQHELAVKEQFSRKKIAGASSIAADQMQLPLKTIQGNVYQLFQTRGITPEIRARLVSIKTAVQRIVQITKKLASVREDSGKVKVRKDEITGRVETYRLLYVSGSDEDFSILNHFMKTIVQCEMTRAMTLAQALDLLSDSDFDLIFIDNILPDGTGLDFIARLKRMRSDIPVILTLERQDASMGPEAVAKGAFTYFIKEEITTRNILAVMENTLKKAKIIRDIQDARNRITMIARKDYLTRLYNRRCFEQALESEISKSKRYNTDLSVLIIDFDNFRQVNRIHGYDSGDSILATSAALIQTMVRQTDVVCRYGGEEFGIVLSGTGLSGARMLGERIRKKLAAHEFELDSGVVKLSVSVGITSYLPGVDQDDSSVVKRALAALTRAMDKGGNRVQTAQA